MNFLFFELILMFLLFYAANNEIKYIYLASGKKIPQKSLNLDFIDTSVKSLFTVGETTTFLYPITLLISEIALLSYIHIYNINAYFLNQFIIVTGLIISISIIAPYYFFYLKEKEQAIIHGYSFKDWLTVSTRSIIREKSEILTSEQIIDFSKIIPMNIKQTKNTYEEYKKHLNKKYILSEEEYFELVPFMNKTNIFINFDNNIYEISEEDIKVISLGFTKMNFSIFTEINLNRMIFSRYFEIIAFFAIINLLIKFGGKQ